MSNKVCLVTGASSGIGFFTALELARTGATTILLCRTLDRGERARAAIAASSGNENVELVLADLSSLSQVRRAAAGLRSRHPKLDVLVNNAAVVPKTRTLTEDGLEMQFVVNHLAPFLLTNLLLDPLRESAPTRVVTVASGMHRQAGVDFANLQAEKRYRSAVQYGVTKLLNLYFTYELARRLERTGVSANCLSPGFTATSIARSLSPITKFLFKRFGKSPELGAETAVYLALSKDVEGLSGKYFENMKEKRSSIRSYDRRIASRVWRASADMAGVS